MVSESPSTAAQPRPERTPADGTGTAGSDGVPPDAAGGQEGSSTTVEAADAGAREAGTASNEGFGSVLGEAATGAESMAVASGSGSRAAGATAATGGPAPWSGTLPVGPVPVIQAPLPPTVIPEIGAASTQGLHSVAIAVPADTGWLPSGPGSDLDPTGPAATAGGAPAAEDATSAAEARSARRTRESGPEPASALTADRLLTGTERPPSAGWRRWLYAATLGYVNVGDSDAVRIRRATEHRIAVRLGGHTRYVPVLSRKGGVGKTTVTTLLGMALAEMREDRIIAMDANPDRGTLSDRSPGRADFTARQLVQNRFMVDSFAQLAHYVTRDGSRLHVLASDTDPAVAQAFDDADYRAVTDILGRYYSIVLTDSGTGMVHSVMKGTLDKADTVVLVSGGSVDEARLASETLSWLEAHGRHDLVEKAIVVINLSSGNGTQVRVEEIEEHFLSRVRTVVRIPYDRHLAEGSRIDLAKLQPATRTAVIELAALVVDELHD